VEALSSLASTYALDADTTKASIWAEMVSLGSISVRHIELGDTDAGIANVGGLSKGVAFGVLRFHIGWKASTAGAACSTSLCLFVRRNDALGALLLGETLGKDSCLHPTPVPILVANYFIGYLGCMLDVLCGTAPGHAPRTAPHKVGRLFVDPTTVSQVVWISSFEIVCLTDHPVDRWLAATCTATLARRLGKNDLE